MNTILKHFDKVLHFGIGSFVAIISYTLLKVTESTMDYTPFLYWFFPLLVVSIVALYKEVLDSLPKMQEDLTYKKVNHFSFWDIVFTILGGCTILPLALTHGLQMELADALGILSALVFIPAIFVWNKISEFSDQYKESVRYFLFISVAIICICFLFFLAQFSK